MKRIPRATAIALGTVAASAVGSAAPGQERSEDTQRFDGFAVVELFTSEGCSSCPPADRLLAEIDKWASQNGAEVYTLSFHVDYWNRLGWADPYSDADYTDRQRDYAVAYESTRVYTPQMIVNGEIEFVGSNDRLAVRALEQALRAESPALLSIEIGEDGPDSISVAYQTTDAPNGAVVNFALIQAEGRQIVPLGENAGRTLHHVNVVRAFATRTVDETGAGEVRLTKPVDLRGPHRVIAYVQDAETKRVVAAASTSPAS